MRRLLTAMSVGMFGGLIALAVVAGVFTERAEAQAGGTSAVLSLGDSLAAGVGASDVETTSYPALVRERVQRITGLETELINLAVPGETTDSLIADGQLDAAVEVLQSRDDVRLVTIDIGGNDVFALLAICAGGFTEECQAGVGTTLQGVGANLAQIVGTLRAAAAPGTPIVIGTYANALRNPGCDFNALRGLGDAVLDGSTALGVATGLNDVIRGVAAATGVAVADAFFALREPDLFQPDCLHFNDAGYAAYAARFNAVLTLGPTGLPATGSGGIAPGSGGGFGGYGAAIAGGAGVLVVLLLTPVMRRADRRR